LLVAPVVLHQHIANCDATQQSAGITVVKHAQAVRAFTEHKKVLQWLQCQHRPPLEVDGHRGQDRAQLLHIFGRVLPADVIILRICAPSFLESAFLSRLPQQVNK